MISVIRAADGTIKTYSEKPEYDFTFSLGETLEYLDLPFAEYASRFRLSCSGRSGETLTVRQGSPDLAVEVLCPGQARVGVDINGLLEEVELVNGKGEVLLSTEVAGVFFIAPADRRLYCAAGEAVMTIEVVPNG